MNTVAAPLPPLAQTETNNHRSSAAGQGFKVTPLPAEFVDRVRRTLRDDFSRSVAILTSKGGEPLRDQLRRAEPGEPIILCSFFSIPLPGTFAEIGPIFISADPSRDLPADAVEVSPEYFNRTFALRAYNALNEIAESALVEPAAAGTQIGRFLSRSDIAFVHARFAGHGCFACRFDRA